mmetsp:Transcript_5106/g.11942  ORF Transcript_5106/g.11942 Transcript_5106/m.11942 type:complete len:208 (-) Transcript_5106:62-685(-)
MDDSHCVNMPQADQNIPGDLADQPHRHTLEIVLLDQSQHVWAHHLKNHADVLSCLTIRPHVRADVLKIIKQLHYSGLLAFDWSRLAGFGQNGDLVVSRFGIMPSTLLDLHGSIPLHFQVLTEPHCREMPPAQLCDSFVPVVVDFPDSNAVVPPDDVPVLPFVVGLVEPTRLLGDGICAVHLGLLGNLRHASQQMCPLGRRTNHFRST